ncbi:hypothetical protein ACHAWF_003369, partial [Thalassiosira exigua]
AQGRARKKSNGSGARRPAPTPDPTPAHAPHGLTGALLSNGRHPSSKEKIMRHLAPSPEYWAQQENGPTASERRRVGSTFGTSRIDPEAERLAAEARVHKKAKRHTEAHVLYTRAIGLDPFNHEYFHHRAEVCSNARDYELGIWDCTAGLDLCFSPNDEEDRSRDECFGLLWCTMTRCCLEMGQVEKAREHCGTGLSVIDESHEDMRYCAQVLRTYSSDIDEMAAGLRDGFVPIRFRIVRNPGHDLTFAYSQKSTSLETPARDANPLQPEVLMVDLEAHTNVRPSEPLMVFLSEKVQEWTKDPDALEKTAEKKALKVPDAAYWITVIPVWSKQQRSVLLTSLMCNCLKTDKVVLVKVDETAEPPVVDTEAYLAAVVKNAPNCEKMYGKGQKLSE